MAIEARQAYLTADRQELAAGDRAEGRGGTPARALCTAAGGEVQDALYASEWLHAFLSVQCGTAVRPSGNRGSYSFYVQPGDHLGLHLDVEECDVTLITVLHDDTAPRNPGGGLLVYPGQAGRPLSTIRAAPLQGARLIKVAPGSSILIFGGLVAHRVLPMPSPGQRVISALCFLATDD